MILIVNVCKEDLHYLEFVKPLEEIVKSMSKKFVTKSYLKITSKDLSNCSSVIICGTSLKDFDYTKNLNRFEWLKDFEKPVLGICAGMQIIGLIFDGKIKKKTEIGFYFETLRRVFRTKRETRSLSFA
jgi:GMP synthase (glutamine-hydrolysing)